jgi:hypothetical protein
MNIYDDVIPSDLLIDLFSYIPISWDTILLLLVLFQKPYKTANWMFTSDFGIRKASECILVYLSVSHLFACGKEVCIEDQVE